MESDLSLLSQHCDRTQFESFDKTRVDYLKNVIQSSITSNEIRNAITPEGDIRPNGFVQMEDINEDDIHLESSVQYIREIMPELGPGFIAMCLKHFNYDNETTLNAILEDNLPQHLATIDRTLTKAIKTGSENAGKEVIGSQICPSGSEHVPQVIDNRKNVFNNDEFDIFRNKNIDLTRIHLGKKEKSVSELKEEDKQKIIAFHSRQLDEEENQAIDYDDEYDDTYEDDTQIDLMTDKCADELDNNLNDEDNDNTNANNGSNGETNRDPRSGKLYNQRYNRGRSRHYQHKQYK